ncbi:hypothetical protein BKA56DRAFT_623210 [Ilyonectria sp. MPI-CAGE-AT-0026]|nr:hypothetical protein BKA56DRAFT_623210 [Ilyonectria sp. MPI-CAGE-AT-0026]
MPMYPNPSLLIEVERNSKGAKCTHEWCYSTYGCGSGGSCEISLSAARLSVAILYRTSLLRQPHEGSSLTTGDRSNGYCGRRKEKGRPLRTPFPLRSLDRELATCEPYLLLYKLNPESESPWSTLLKITKVKGHIFMVAEGFIDCGSVLTKSGMFHWRQAPKLMPNTMSHGSQTVGTMFIADMVESEDAVICIVVVGLGIPTVVQNASELDSPQLHRPIETPAPKVDLVNCTGVLDLQALVYDRYGASQNIDIFRRMDVRRLRRGSSLEGSRTRNQSGIYPCQWRGTWIMKRGGDESSKTSRISRSSRYGTVPRALLRGTHREVSSSHAREI